jgi:hypothetical protein
MSKDTITKLFIGGLIAVVAGFVVVIAVGLSTFAGNVVVIDGSDVTVSTPVSMHWTAIVAAVLGVMAMLGGALAGFAAWIGALVNTAQLEDKLWFVILLVTGLLSFGFVAMLVYVIAGPDSTQRTPRPEQPVTWVQDAP